MNRRGVEMYVAGIILVAVGLVVMLFVMRGFGQNVERQESKVGCSANLILSALTSKLPIAQEVPVACRMKVETITEEMVKKKQKQSKKHLERLKSPANPDRGLYDRPGIENEVALDGIVADKLADCWNKVLRGKLNLFSRSATSGELREKSICIVCSQLIFSNEVKNMPLPSYDLKPENAQAKLVGSIPAYLKIVPVGTESYFDFLAAGQTHLPNFAYAYSPTVDYAVLYYELHPSWGESVRSSTVATILLSVTVPIVAAAVMLEPLLGSATSPVSGSAMSVMKLRQEVATNAALAHFKAVMDYRAANTPGEPGRYLLLAPFDILRKPTADGGLGCKRVIA